MKIKTLNPVFYKSFKTLNINHGFFTKNGGVSSKENFSLNCSYSSNDCKNNVLINRKLICEHFNLKLANLKTVNQIHSNQVKIVENIDDDTSHIEADALVTKSPNIILGILTADCAPVLIQDPLKNIIAAVHIGWKGAHTKILHKTIESLINLGSDVNNIKLAIGPCIGPTSYEVGNDFYEKFTKENIINKIFFERTKLNKFNFNLSKYIYHQAISIGIQDNNISNTDKDTFTDKKDFFSYRRNFKNKLNDCGRMISTISMKIQND